MNEILFNLALIDATNFCKDNGIDCAGSHLVKDGRGYSYTLIHSESGRRIVTVTFHKTSVPTHLVYPGVAE